MGNLPASTTDGKWYSCTPLTATATTTGPALTEVGYDLYVWRPNAAP
jgi:hypothetical protein